MITGAVVGLLVWIVLALVTAGVGLIVGDGVGVGDGLVVITADGEATGVAIETTCISSSFLSDIRSEIEKVIIKSVEATSGSKISVYPPIFLVIMLRGTSSIFS